MVILDCIWVTKSVFEKKMVNRQLASSYIRKFSFVIYLFILEKITNLLHLFEFFRNRKVLDQYLKYDFFVTFLTIN